MKPRSPDFICIGAQKAGTCWLRENLRAHPRVWMPMVPELHYFDGPLGDVADFSPRLAVERMAAPERRNAALAKLQQLVMAEDLDGASWWAMHAFVDRDERWYRSLFAFAPEGSLAGEITPRYMLCGEQEVAHMHSVAPEARLIFLLRHPVERFWSQCRMKYADGTLARGTPAAMHLLDSSNGRPRGIYSKAIVRFCKRFRPEQMLLVFHEGIRRQPAAVMEAIFDFLQLPRVPLNVEMLKRPVNRASCNDPMPPDLEARVRATYRSEIEVLARVLGGYAAGWLEEAGETEDATPPVLRLAADQVRELENRTHRSARPGAGKGKIFCVSMQRSATTSVGDWLEAHGFTRAGSPTSVRLGWTRMWMQGAYDAIFSSKEFVESDVFEDDPWWCPDFFKVVADRFPDARFILLERDPATWFDSMCHHSGGRNPGWTDIHARIYGREPDLKDLMSRKPSLTADTPGLLSIVGLRDHYQSIYKHHIEAVKDWFSTRPGRLFHQRLENPGVFEGICEFVGVRRNPAIAFPRSNARTEEMRRALKAHLEESAAVQK